MIPPKKIKSGLKQIKAILFVLASFYLSAYSQTQPVVKNQSDPRLIWNINELDLGRGSAEITNLEADVLLELNMARTNPAKYAELYIKPMLEFFDDKLYKDFLLTEEGTAAVEECIKVLTTATKLKPLTLNKKLVTLAKYHTKKQSITNETGHDSPCGKNFKTRYKRLVKKGFMVGENISYGESEARNIVVQLLIDDGVPGRGHRKNIFEPRFTYAGVAFGNHLKHGNMCTINFYGDGIIKKKKR